MFNAAERDRLIAASPCVEVKRPRPAPASTLEVLTTEQVCFANVATGFDPGTSKLPTYSASHATTVARVRHQVDASASSTFEYVPGAALVVAPDNTVRLCAAGTTSYQTVCTDGPRVNGIDASSLRQQYPAAYQIVRGDLLLRTRNGAVEDTAFTHGYTITTFSPTS